MEEALPGPDAAALIEAAAVEGRSVSRRSLELWRSRGLLPRPERQAGGRAVWLYPRGSERQLSRLLYWRQRTRSLDEILLALWVEGFAIEGELARGALLRFTQRWLTMIDTELGEAAKKDETAFVDAWARKVARVRGKGSLPRGSRMRLADRERACGYLVSAVFGMEDELARREADLPHLERLLGLRRGHGGGLSTTMPLRDGGGEGMRLPSAKETEGAVREARPEELELVRRVMWMLTTLFPVLIPTLFVEQAVKAHEFTEIAVGFFSEPPPGFFPFAATVLLVLLRSKEAGLEELRGHLEALQPSVVRGGLAELLTDNADAG
jgi:DNA-binding transcriptional MerR regulator